MATDWQVPILNGNHVTRVFAFQLKNGRGVYRPRWEFVDTLKYVDYSRGRSSVTVTLASLTDGTTYQATLKEFVVMIPLLVDGCIKGKFGFLQKGGSVVSLHLIEHMP